MHIVYMHTHVLTHIGCVHTHCMHITYALYACMRPLHVKIRTWMHVHLLDTSMLHDMNACKLCIIRMTCTHALCILSMACTHANMHPSHGKHHSHDTAHMHASFTRRAHTQYACILHMTCTHAICILHMACTHARIIRMTYIIRASPMQGMHASLARHSDMHASFARHACMHHLHDVHARMHGMHASFTRRVHACADACVHVIMLQTHAIDAGSRRIRTRILKYTLVILGTRALNA
jgi:hypothetical protein